MPPLLPAPPPIPPNRQVKGSYESVPLPRVKAYAVRCKEAGPPKAALELGTEALPPALEWGEVLLSVRFAPINPADL